MNLNQWAIRWGVTQQALDDLHATLGLDTATETAPALEGKSEAAVVALARLAASKQGGRLWRNNSGAGYMTDGSFVRWGLCNESKEINAVIKSSDLIGVRPRIVTPDMIGQRVGVFWARECKEPGWRFTGTEREQAQLRFISLVTSLGGDAAFWNGSDAL
jgi:hypothetical protein